MRGAMVGTREQEITNAFKGGKEGHDVFVLYVCVFLEGSRDDRERKGMIGASLAWP